MVVNACYEWPSPFLLAFGMYQILLPIFVGNISEKPKLNRKKVFEV
jgi:hypothetical protein